MSERFDNHKKPRSNVRNLLQERDEKANPRHELTTEEAKRLAKLEVIADKLRRGENVQSRLQKIEPQWKNSIRNPIQWQYIG